MTTSSPYSIDDDFEILSTTINNAKDENSSTNENELKMGSFEDESSIEKKFLANENEFRNNNTREERRLISEGMMDEETIKYDQKASKLVRIDDSNETTEQPTSPRVVTSAKKGKLLDLLQSESDNVNMTIPNIAEVWTLAGMKNVVPKNHQHDESTENGNHEMKMTSNAKNLFDWSEIARMTDLRSKEIETNASTQTTDSELENLSTTAKTNRDETTTEFSNESRTTNSDETSTEELLLPKNGKGISQLTTANTEQPVETTENSIEIINSTKDRDEDLMTISSALSGTTETSSVPTTTIKVTPTTVTMTSQQPTIISTTSIRKRKTTTPTTTEKTFASIDQDDILAASSSNPQVTRVTTTFEPAIINEDEKHRYNTFHEFAATTDTVVITTEKQIVNVNDDNTDSSGLGVISAVISVILLLSCGALAYVSKYHSTE